MSRSRRKSPFMAWTCSDSEKQDKTLWHRAWRRSLKQMLPIDWDTPNLRVKRDDPWEWDKDGKQRITDPKWMRK